MTITTQAENMFAPGLVTSLKSGRKNTIINGDFDIWQRAITQTTSEYGSDDRWNNQNTGSTKVADQQTFTLGQTDVPDNPEFFSRTIVTSVANAANVVRKFQRIEGVQGVSGENITLSFWAKADAAKNIATEFLQHFGSGGSPSAIVDAIGVTTHALTTSWQKFTTVVAVPSITGKTLGTGNDDYLQLSIFFDAGSNFDARTNSLGQQSGTFDISHVQIEGGSEATNFESRPIAEELALCYRYYETGTNYRSGVLLTSTLGLHTTDFKTKKRASATVVITTVDSLSNFTGAALGTANTFGFPHYPTGGSSNAQGRYRISWTADSEL
jgi:hypothetical protein